jgi:hypothetical protein
MSVTPRRSKFTVSPIPGGMTEPEMRIVFGLAATAAFTSVSVASITIASKLLCHAIAIPVYQHH